MKETKNLIYASELAWWVRSVRNGDKWLKRVKIGTSLQVKGKTWHKKLDGVTRVTKSRIGGKNWNSLFY